MYSTLRTASCVLVAGLTLAVGSFAAPAHAAVLLDIYYGGLDTWNYPSDVIGDPNTFGIDSAVIQRTAGTLQITINTNFAGKPGTAAADGTGYGALFITPGKNAWTPQGSGPNYFDDQYQAGDWTYAASIPQNPNQTSGQGALYQTSGGAVVLSNVAGHSQTYPNDPTSPFYFRSGQAVQFAPGINQTGVPGTFESWAIGSGTITFSILDNGFLGDDFALSWAITCGNDVIQGQVSIPQVSVPEPSTWPVLLAGILFMGALRLRSSRRPEFVGI
jgi:hypothetical protein